MTEYITSAKLQWQAANGLHDITLSYGKYGEEKKQLDPSTLQRDGEAYAVFLTELDAYSAYDFIIGGKTAAGEDATYTGVITTRGYPVAINVKKDNNNVKDAKITVLDYVYTTDESGAIFIELPSGNVSATLEYGTLRQSITIPVEALSVNDSEGAVPVQEFTYQLDQSAGGGVSLWWLLLLLVPALAVVGVIVLKRRRGKTTEAWAPLTGIYSSAPVQPTTSVQPETAYVPPVQTKLPENEPLPPQMSPEEPPVAEELVVVQPDVLPAEPAPRDEPVADQSPVVNEPVTAGEQELNEQSDAADGELTIEHKGHTHH